MAAWGCQCSRGPLTPGSPPDYCCHGGKGDPYDSVGSCVDVGVGSGAGIGSGVGVDVGVGSGAGIGSGVGVGAGI